MPYKIVQVVEGKKVKLTTVPSGWETDNILKYPKKGLSNYINDEYSMPGPDWEVMMCIVKRSNISSYNNGKKIITNMLAQSDTDDSGSDECPQKRYPQKNQDAININNVADKIVKRRHPQNKHSTSTLCLDNVADTMMGNAFYFENPQENSTNTTTITSATVLPEKNYTVNDRYNFNNPTVQESISTDIDKIFENQKRMLEYQKQMLTHQRQMLDIQRQILENQAHVFNQITENQKQLLDSNTAILAQSQSQMKAQNNVIQKLSDLSVQLTDAVVPITGIDNTGATEVALCKNSKDLYSTPFYIKQIDTPQELDELENKLSDNNFRNRLKNTFSVLSSKGRKGVDCAYTLVDILFTRSFLCQCSWSGGSRSDYLKVPLKGYKHVLSFFWEMIHFWDENYTIKDNEIFFKIVLKNAHKRKMAKFERASTSRKRAKSCKVKRQKTKNSENEINDNNGLATQETNIRIDEYEIHIGEDEYQNTQANDHNEEDQSENKKAEKERKQTNYEDDE